MPENEWAPVHVVRGLLGVYEAGFSGPPYTHDRVYSRTEFRDIWDYELALDDHEQLLLVYHLGEIAGKKCAVTGGARTASGPRDACRTLEDLDTSRRAPRERHGPVGGEAPDRGDLSPHRGPRGARRTVPGADHTGRHVADSVLVNDSIERATASAASTPSTPADMIPPA